MPGTGPSIVRVTDGGAAGAVRGGGVLQARLSNKAQSAFTPYSLPFIYSTFFFFTSVTRHAFVPKSNHVRRTIKDRNRTVCQSCMPRAQLKFLRSPSIHATLWVLFVPSPKTFRFLRRLERTILPQLSIISHHENFAHLEHSLNSGRMSQATYLPKRVSTGPVISSMQALNASEMPIPQSAFNVKYAECDCELN